MPDFSTPESAVLALQAAYLARDLEAAVACKNFMAEAELMLWRLNPKVPPTEDVVTQAAEVLELSFRAHIQGSGFPDFSGVQSSFPYREHLAENLVILMELCRFPDGHITEQKLYIYNGPEGWRVLNPVTHEAPRSAA